MENRKFWEDEIITNEDVYNNLERAKLGIELTIPLHQLSRNSLFIKKYNKWCHENDPKFQERKKRKKEYDRIRRESKQKK